MASIVCGAAALQGLGLTCPLSPPPVPALPSSAAVFGGGYYVYRRGLRAGQTSSGLLGSRSASGGSDGAAGGAPWVKSMDGELAAAEAGGKGALAPAAAATGAVGGTAAFAGQRDPAPVVYYSQLPSQGLPAVRE